MNNMEILEKTADIFLSSFLEIVLANISYLVFRSPVLEFLYFSDSSISLSALAVSTEIILFPSSWY